MFFRMNTHTENRNLCVENICAEVLDKKILKCVLCRG